MHAAAAADTSFNPRERGFSSTTSSSPFGKNSIKLSEKFPIEKNRTEKSNRVPRALLRLIWPLLYGVTCINIGTTTFALIIK